MRIVFVQTYPIYHEHWTARQWLGLLNRDRWMPGVAAAMGHEVELWAVADEEGVFPSVIDGFGDYTIRLFRPTGGGRRTKFQFSDDLVAAARQAPPDLFVLKGTDGGAGERLLGRCILPQRVPFAFVVGGKYYTPRVPLAQAVFYETDRQARHLARPWPHLWRRAVARDRLIRLPKSVDTDAFRPLPGVEKTWDLLAVGRLVPRNKRYDALGALAGRYRVAVAGGGPMEAELRRRYPKVDWLGQVPHHRLPDVLARTRVFFHPSTREYYPRVLAEAAACGLPALGFAGAIDADVLPDAIGVRLDRRHYVDQIDALLADAARLDAMSRAARDHALAHLGRHSSRRPLAQLLDTLPARPAGPILTAP